MYRNNYSKYHTAPKEMRTYKGMLFASKMEMTRYIELEMLVKSGEIKNLTRQPRFTLLPKVNGFKAEVYVADFIYDEVKSGKKVVEEVKGYETKIYKLKARLFRDKFPQYDFRVIKP